MSHLTETLAAVAASKPGTPRWLCYGVAALAVAAAFVILLTTPRTGWAVGTPQLVLSLAVLVAAWYGGFGPGMFATALIVLLTWPQTYTGPSTARVAVFVAGGALASMMMESLHRARQRAQQEAAERWRNEEALRKSEASKTGIQEELRQQAEALREAARRKDEFLAMLAHELRNPLAAIEGALTLAACSANCEDRDWSQATISRNIKHLARLIDDLLDISRVTRGKIALRKEHVDAAVVIDHAVAAVRHLIAARNHEFGVSLNGRPLWLEADRTRLEQILSNLLMNAIQHGKDGTHICLNADRRGSEVVISVRDNGRGITPELLPRVFDLFTQGDRSLARSEGGLGIGLTMVKALTELHGGTVTAASEGPEKGSEFVVSLPASPVCVGTGTAAPMPVVTNDSSGGRVLVVDDNKDLTHALTVLLSRHGYEARAVHDGPSAIFTARAYQPEVVLLDIGLPGMDGYEVARRLRLEEGFEETKIIAITGYGHDDCAKQAALEPFDHRLIKPIQIDNLVPLLKKRDSAKPRGAERSPQAAIES